MKRLLFASAAAYACFKSAWSQYDPDELAAKRYEAKQQERAKALHESFSALSQSDQHFLNSFVNNLTSERPSRVEVERFSEILQQLPEQARVHVLRQAVAVCPVLVCMAPVVKLVRDLDVSFERVT